MRPFTDITGQLFGYLTVLEKSNNPKYSRAHFLCQCRCGIKKVISGTELRLKRTRSCGCSKATFLSQAMSFHGMSRTLIYSKWAKMIGRCHNPKYPSYLRYGARGIKVCEDWHKFNNFFNDMGEPPTPRHSIERINNDGNYEPGNCKWATRKEQANNRSDNILIEFNGQKKTVAQWSDQFSMSRTMLYQRIHRGIYPPELFQSKS